LQTGGETPLETTFELNDTLYARATISPEDMDEVYLWLGANVMLAYPIEEAEALLEEKLQAAQASLANCEEDLEFLREQITVRRNSIYLLDSFLSGVRRTPTYLPLLPIIAQSTISALCKCCVIYFLSCRTYCPHVRGTQLTSHNFNSFVPLFHRPSKLPQLECTTGMWYRNERRKTNTVVKKPGLKRRRGQTAEHEERWWGKWGKRLSSRLRVYLFAIF
jgi:hypothetical protein